MLRPRRHAPDRACVARHERSTVRGSATLVLDHYLEVLVRKPGALPGATALVQARKAGVFTTAHDAFWAAARRAHRDADGTRELVEVLLLHRHLNAADVVDGLTTALTVGAVRADQRPIDLTAPATAASEHVREPGALVASLTERRLADPTAVIAGLPPDGRPLPSVTAYDELLHRRTTRTPPTPAGLGAGSTEGQVS